MSKISLSVKQLKQMFEAAKSAISPLLKDYIKDSIRVDLQYAKAVKEGSKLRVVACDGFKITELTLSLQVEDEYNFEFYFQPFKIPKGVTAAVIENRDNVTTITVVCKDYEIKYKTPKPEGNFIDINRIFPTSTPFTVSVDANKLIAALKPFTLTEDANNIVTLKFAEANNTISKTLPIVLGFNKEGVEIRGLILPVRAEGE